MAIPACLPPDRKAFCAPIRAADYLRHRLDASQIARP